MSEETKNKIITAFEEWAQAVENNNSIANGYIWTSLYFEEPTQFVGRTNDGMYIHTNVLTMRTYLTEDAHGLQVIRKAKCDSITTGEVVTAYVAGHPITTIMGTQAYSESSWKINKSSKRKLVQHGRSDF